MKKTEEEEEEAEEEEAMGVPRTCRRLWGFHSTFAHGDLGLRSIQGQALHQQQRVGGRERGMTAASGYGDWPGRPLMP